MNKIRILLIDLEYKRNELNEPINIDTIIDSLDSFVLENTEIDLWYRTLGDFTDRMPENYDLVLISSKVTSGMSLIKLLDKFINKPTIIGGMLATYAHDYILSKYPDVIISLGECECNLNTILSCFIHERNFERVKALLPTLSCSGVAWVHTSGKIEMIPIKACDLSEIHTPLKHRTIETIVSKHGLVRIEGSRGCPWNKCSFCCIAWKYGGTNWRHFPISRTIEELKLLSNSGANCAYFTDEDFVGCSSYFFSLFSIVASLIDTHVLRKDMQIWGSTSVYTLSHFTAEEFDKFINLAKKCNIQVFFLGIESGCCSQLLRFNKGVTPEDNLRVLRALNNTGILVDAGFILFDAETTLEEVRENLNFCKNSGLDRSIARLAKSLRVIPHTQIYNTYQEKGFLTGELNFNELMYEYQIKDIKVRTLFEGLLMIDNCILDFANQLQAKIRMEGNYNTEEYAFALSEYRQVDFKFIEEFVEAFLHSPLDTQLSDALVKKYLLSINTNI